MWCRTNVVANGNSINGVILQRPGGQLRNIAENSIQHNMRRRKRCKRRGGTRHGRTGAQMAHHNILDQPFLFCGIKQGRGSGRALQFAGGAFDLLAGCLPFRFGLLG